jgi:hypothetical protein
MLYTDANRAVVGELFSGLSPVGGWLEAPAAVRGREVDIIFARRLVEGRIDAALFVHEGEPAPPLEQSV